MQPTNNGNDKGTNHENDGESSAGENTKHVKRKHVGDETPNPLPNEDYSSKQPSGDTTEATPQGESSTD